MPICRRSTTRRARLLAAIALAPLLVGASEPQDAAGQHRDGNARTRIQDQGEAAMERVKRAADKAKTAKPPSPALPVKADAAAQ